MTFEKVITSIEALSISQRWITLYSNEYSTYSSFYLLLKNRAKIRQKHMFSSQSGPPWRAAASEPNFAFFDLKPVFYEFDTCFYVKIGPFSVQFKKHPSKL